MLFQGRNCTYAISQDYLSGLGFSKAIVALVWLTGPVFGATLQPLIGLLSDKCHSAWGKRRPFIISGTVTTVIPLLVFALVDYESSTTLETSEFPDVRSTFLDSRNLTVLLFAIMNAGIQPLQSGLRSLIVDACPVHQQQTANAWAARVINGANVLSYLASSLDLPRYLQLSEYSHFQILCGGAGIHLTVTVAITCLSVQETVLPIDLGESGRTLWAEVDGLRITFRRLPDRIRSVFRIQFFAWMGWFPFLFYISTYVSERCKFSSLSSYVQCR
jgi:solute carrier family 45 protein 1/2/4